ncbi:hypothetical protein F4825DRAFT_470996 [Nemania diffusa]|nr:hypothetical protein F4825DRAFT_470996 [Nemania diffusa]
MAGISSTENGSQSENYHRHPLYPKPPLKEAVQKGLAVPVDVSCSNGGLGKDKTQSKGLRLVQSTDECRRDFSMAGSLNRRNAFSPTAFKQVHQRRTGLTTLRETWSQSDMTNVNSSNSPVSADTEVEEGVKKNIQETVQETAQELRDRLELQGDVPVPAPLNVRKNRIPRPVLPRIDEHEYNGISSQTTAAEETVSPAMSSLSRASARRYPSRLPRYQPQFPVQGKPQVKPQPTQAIPTGKQEDSFLLPPVPSSSLSTLACKSATHAPTSINNRAGADQHSLKATSNTPLLVSFGNALPDNQDPTDLTDLPFHLRPENKYSPTIPIDATRHISFATTARKHNLETGEVVEIPVKLTTRHEMSYKAGRNQGTPEHSPTSSICSFNSENKQLETDILALLDNMAGASKRFSLPPPCPPPNYPPPPPPTQRRFSQPPAALGSPGSATQQQEQQQKYPDVVIKDFSLPASAYANALANPYDDEETANDVHDDDASDDAQAYAYPDTTNNLPTVDADDDDIANGGWLVLQQRALQRAAAPYLAAQQTPNDDALARAMAEVLRMADEAEAESKAEATAATTTATKAETSNKHSTPAPTTATATHPSALPAATGLGIATTVAGNSTGILGGWRLKPAFLERCGRALAKKGSFWKKGGGK